MNLCNVDPRQLIPTEKIIPESIPSLIQAIGLDKDRWPPIIILDELYILDGHHRREIALMHSFNHLPAYCFSYFDPKIKVFDYKDGTELDKVTLLKIYQSGTKFEPKTTRHVIEL